MKLSASKCPAENTRAFIDSVLSNKTLTKLLIDAFWASWTTWVLGTFELAKQVLKFYILSIFSRLLGLNFRNMRLSDLDFWFSNNGVLRILFQICFYRYFAAGMCNLLELTTDFAYKEQYCSKEDG